MLRNTNNNNEEYIVAYNLYQNVLLFLFLMHTCCYITVSKNVIFYRLPETRPKVDNVPLHA